MFDQITEENYYGRGECDDSDEDEGEDATRRIRKFRQQIEHLNSDLHDLIYSGEDEESGADEVDEGQQLTGINRSKVPAFKKMGSGKPQNLDLLPSSYSMKHNSLAQADPARLNLDMISTSSMGYFEPQQQFVPPMPAHMIKEVVQVIDEDTYIV